MQPHRRRLRAVVRPGAAGQQFPLRAVGPRPGGRGGRTPRRPRPRCVRAAAPGRRPSGAARSPATPGARSAGTAGAGGRIGSAGRTARSAWPRRRSLGAGVRRLVEQFGQRAAQHGSSAARAGRRRERSRGRSRPRSTSQACCADRPRRRSRPAASRVPIRGVSVWGPVQVPECHVVDALEDRRRHRSTPPTQMSRSLSLATPPPTNACARTTDRTPGRRNEIGPHPLHRRAVSTASWLRPAPPRRAQLVPGHLGLQEGQAVDRDLAVLVGQQHRLVEPAGAARTWRPGPADRPGDDVRGGGPSRGSRSQDHRAPARSEPPHDAVEHAGGVGRGHGPVVDVARHDDASTGSSTVASAAGRAPPPARRAVPCRAATDRRASRRCAAGAWTGR